ncbi:MAG: cupin domain-containing protein [Defluviitaleaceae bacterium]|nr:cupin domain-containing protein [Defluviitaleaceae bacterium]
MIRKQEQQRTFTRGIGVEIRVLAEPDEMFEAGRLYARITVEPGASLDLHRHEEEMESFYVAKGTCRVRDNEADAVLREGDMLITPDGQTHAVYNESDEPAELIALIVSRKQGVNGKSVPLV